MTIGTDLNNLPEFNESKENNDQAPLLTGETFTKVQDGVYRGTVRDFVENGLKFNGQFLDVAALSVFGRYGMLPVVAQFKPQRGRPASIYEVDLSKHTGFSITA